MTSANNPSAILIKAKCEINLQKYKQAEESLIVAIQNPESNRSSVRSAFIVLYREWNTKPEEGIKISLAILKDMMSDGKLDKIKKVMKDLLHFYLKIPLQFVNQALPRETLLAVAKDLMMSMQEEAIDPELDNMFLGMMESIFHKSLVDMGKLEDLISRCLSKIYSPHAKDALLELYLKNKIETSSWPQLIQLLKAGKSSQYYGLPSFSIYSLVYGYGYSDVQDHFEIILALFSNRKEFESKRYKSDIIFTLETVSDICRKAGDLLKLPLPVLTDDQQILIDKNRKEFNIDLSKKIPTDINRSLSNLVSNVPTLESVDYVLKLVKENRADLSFE